MRILLVEDEHRISAYIKRGLEESGYVVDAVFNGRDALDWAEAAPYDLIILDIMLPEMDGLSVCRRLRQRGDRTAVLMLTARDAIDDRVKGLDAGADDYLVKPFAKSELIVKVERILAGNNREEPVAGEALPYVLDGVAFIVKRGGRASETLTSKEFQIMSLLDRASDQGLSRNEIEQTIWDSVNVSRKTLDVHLCNLRSKLTPVGIDITSFAPHQYRITLS